VLTVTDDGVGLPPHVNGSDAGSFGLQLVDTLIGQLEGSIAIASDGGTAYTIRFMDRK
jgi:two-component sensor histidine kinase